MLSDFLVDQQCSQQQKSESVAKIEKQETKFNKKQKKVGQSQKPAAGGRQKCDCQTQLVENFQEFFRKHKLINNCLKCGRIVCELEGSGPCLFCGNPVFSTKEDQNNNKNAKDIAFLISNPGDLIDSALAEEFPEISGQNTKKQIQKREGKKVENFEKVQQEQEKEAKRLEFERNVAVNHRNRLLEQDHEQNLQKNIYDSQMDWYEISHDVWQSKETRDQAVRNMIAEQLDFDESKKKIQIEFDGWGAGFKEIKPHKNEDQSKENAQGFIAEVEKLRRNQLEQVATIEASGQLANFKETFGSDAKNEKLSKEALSNAKLSLLNSCPNAKQDQKNVKLDQTASHFPGAKRVMTEIYQE